MMRNDFDKGEFMDFMDEFLDHHPDVVKDQEYGWDIYWHLTRFDPNELNPQLFEEQGNPAMESYRVDSPERPLAPPRWAMDGSFTAGYESSAW